MATYIRILTMGALLLVAACAQAPRVDFNDQTGQLVGYTEEAIMACAGLPDGSLKLESGPSALLYSKRRISVEPSPFGTFRRWGSCPWGATSMWCDTPFFLDNMDVEEDTCRLAFWTEAGKVVGVTGEYSSASGQQLCRKIIAPCLQGQPQAKTNPPPTAKSDI